MSERIDDVAAGTATDDVREIRRARSGRRAWLAGLTVLVLAGASGLLGIRTAEATSEAGPYELTVTYPSIARPGIAISWEVKVVRAGGFTGPIRIATASDYLAMFDENGLDPDPASATADGTELIWEFDPPPGDTLVVSYDARLEPSVQMGRRGTTRVLDEAGTTIVAVSYRTWVMP
ncbi:MAG TPA: hypothetical protein VM841_15160 [Actinomycetota bacterium]|nr:hypothetical protein [Actinomycetota bacterium]